jgi:hypothetical protein
VTTLPGPDLVEHASADARVHEGCKVDATIMPVMG